MADTLQDRLRLKASMISMGEKIAWGSDTAIMNEAADALDAKDAEIARLREALAEEAKIYVTAPGEGVCVGGRFDGWLMRKHADGQWVSVRKLEAVNPMDAMPEWMRALAKTSNGGDNG